MVGVVVALFALLLAASFFIYWLRLFYDFNVVSAPIMVFFAYITFVAVFSAIMAAKHFCTKNFAATGAALVFFCGLLFALASPPLQVPDENYHFLRSYSISTGKFDFDPSREYPRDVAVLVQKFEPFYSHLHQIPSEKIGYQFTAYYEALENDEPAGVTEPLVLMFLPYLVPGAAIALIRLFGGTALYCLYAARIANLIVFALLCFWALKNTKKFRLLFLSSMLLPTTLFMASSVSYDSVMLGIVLVLLSFMFKEHISTASALFAVTITAFACYIKTLNFLLLVPLFLVSKEQWKCRFSKPVLAVSSAILCFGINFFMNLYVAAFSLFPPAERLDSVDPIGQLSFIFTSLPRFAAIMFGSLYENGFYLTRLGVFGWLDTPVPIVSVAAPIIMLFTAMFYGTRETAEKSKILPLTILGIIYILAVMVGLYATNTPVGMVRIIGVQPRYMLPALYLLAIAFSILSAGRFSIKSRFSGSFAVVLLAGFSSISALLLFATHYAVL